jgi:phosphoribosylglycinamide formyltransferase-1
MRIAGLMSGSGTNLQKILEYECILKRSAGGSPFHVAVIFTDTFDCNAARIGMEYDRPVVIRDIGRYYSAREQPRKNMQLRAEYDQETVRALAPFDVSVAAYAGYMSVATAPLINAFLGVNVHPADLTVMADGKRKYTGDKAVRKAILAGEPTIRATTHIIREQVDYGEILMLSAPLPVDLPPEFDAANPTLVQRVADAHQKRLKEIGDWAIFPKTLLAIAEGRYAKDESGALYFDGKPIPLGINVGDVQ